MDREMSGRELGRQARFAHTKITLIEEGQVSVTLPTMQRLASALGVTVSEMINNR
jgi:DNA-binding Xre family transcriptional regulator